MPSVMRKALARASASPIQPVFHSQSLRRHINDFGVPLPNVGPGTKRRLTKKMMTAGTTRETITSTVVEMVSFSLKGKEMLASTGENGRRFGVILVNRAPTIAMSLCSSISKMRVIVAGKLVHDHDPIDDIREDESLGQTPSAGCDRIHVDLERLN